VQFDRWTVLFLVRQDDPPNVAEAESDRVQDAHLAHLERLHRSGALVAAGPMDRSAESRVAGICIFGTSVEEARAAMREDPAVKAGYFRTEVLSWSVPEGIMKFLPGRFPRSMEDARSP